MKIIIEIPEIYNIESFDLAKLKEKIMEELDKHKQKYSIKIER